MSCVHIYLHIIQSVTIKMALINSRLIFNRSSKYTFKKDNCGNIYSVVRSWIKVIS